MLRHPLAYSPLTLTDEAEVSVKLKLLAGHHLGSGDIVVDLLVHGHPLDETACRWSSSPAAGPHPHWPDGGEQVMLTVRMPQLAVLQVKTIILIRIMEFQLCRKIPPFGHLSISLIRLLVSAGETGEAIRATSVQLHIFTTPATGVQVLSYI